MVMQNYLQNHKKQVINLNNFRHSCWNCNRRPVQVVYCNPHNPANDDCIYSLEYRRHIHYHCLAVGCGAKWIIFSGQHNG